MPGYYDIDDILMEEEPISVVFQVSANGVGLLDPGAERNSVSDFCTYGLVLWCNFLGHLLTFLPPSLLF
jgi:GINS complex subunit 3